ncbi:MAG TPA: hypothetical protein PK760_16290, partial [Flavobacteriales bacterium]|nr:hypothetical protein [Flavobacteriales bacterium]
NVVSPISSSQATPATAVYWNELWELQKEKIPDSTLFAQRRNSSSYCHLTPCDTIRSTEKWLDKRRNFRRQSNVPEITVKGYKGEYDPEHVVFTISISEDDDKQFPEWRRLPSHAAWEYLGSESRALFKQLYGRKHYYQDVALVMRNGATEGLLRLKENGEWIELPVGARYNMSSNYKAAGWNRALANYNASLAKHERNFDREVNKRTARYRREHKSMPATAWKEAKSSMQENEKAMLLDPWIDYAATRKPVRWVANENSQRDLATVTTTFGLQDFGVYNIDRIMKMKDQQNVLASAVDADGKPWPWVNGFAVLKNENSVITYWGTSGGTGDNFLVSPGNMKSLFL